MIGLGQGGVGRGAVPGINGELAGDQGGGPDGYVEATP
jgi:hypothetical protein